MKASAATLLIFCAATLLPAQDFRATLNGTVVDASGAAVPKVKVQVTNIQTGVVSVAETLNQGEFSVPFLLPGTYTASAEAPGFKKALRENIILRQGQAFGITLVLQPGDVTEQVTVSAEAPLLETEMADRATVIDNVKVTELPVTSRNPLMLAVMVAGVTFRGGSNRVFDNSSIDSWSVNGGFSGQSTYLLDGAPNHAFAGNNYVALVPEPEAVEEVSIKTSTYDAQYGNSGSGIVSMTFKSGSNDLHGSVYTYQRNGRWNANTFTANRDGVPKGASYTKQYGTQVGGPVFLPKVYNGRNRTFFMWAYEHYNDNVAASSTFTVPAPEFSQGDFSKLVDSQKRKITIYDPMSGRDVNGKWTRDAFAGNIIPQTRLNQIALNIMSHFPAPNYVSPNSSYASGNFNVPAGMNNPTNNFYNLATKFDQNFGSRDRVFFRFAANSRQEHKQTTAVINAPGESESQTSRVNRAYDIDWVRTFSPTLIFNTNWSVNRFIQTSRGDENWNYDPTKLGFSKQLVSVLPYQNNFGIYAIGGQQQLGWDDRLGITTNYTTHPNITWVRSAHKIHAGVDIRFIQYSVQDIGSFFRLTSSNGLTQADYLQSDPLSGNGVASWVLGYISGGSAEWRAHPYISDHYFAPYVQDDWKVNRRLTLTLGLRYDINQPPVERFNHLSTGFDITHVNSADKLIDRTKFANVPTLHGGLLFANSDSRRAAPTYWGAIQPRIGVAYQVNNRVIFRGGWGRYYMNLNNSLFQTQGYTYSNSAISSNDSGKTPAPNSLANPFPNGILQPYGSSLGDLTFLGSGLNWVNPEAKPGHMDEFSAGFQIKLPMESVLDISYVGSRGKEVQSSLDINGANSYSLAARQSCNWYEGGRYSNCSDTVPNPFQNLAPFLGTSLYTSTTITKATLLLQKYPAFGSLNEVGRNDIFSWYNALQMTYETRKKGGLNFLITLTYAKNIIDNGWDDIQRGLRRRAIDTASAPPFRSTMALVYDLPLGKGKRFLSGAGGVVSRLVGGWQMSALGQWSKAGPLGLPGNLIMIGDPTQGYKLNWGAEVSQVWNQCVARMNNDGSITMLPNAVSQGCTSYSWLMLPTGSGISNPANLLAASTWKVHGYSYPQLDASFSKITQIAERVKLQFRGDAYDATNSVGRGGINTTPDSNNFGKVFKRDSRGDTYRQLQFSLKVLF